MTIPVKKVPMKTKVLQVDLPVDLMKGLKMFATQRDVTLTAILTEILSNTPAIQQYVNLQHEGETDA